jgi:N-acetylglucosamine-6-phosphate deacetylase
MKKIINGIVWYDGKFFDNQEIYFEEYIRDTSSEEEITEVIDAEGAYVLPGFINVHIHGYKGDDAMDGDLESLHRISSNVVENGVTAFLPTTMTMSMDCIKKALEVIRLAQKTDNEGAIILGAHLEGPFIHKDKKGAQPGEYIIPPDKNFIKEYLDVLKVVTIAPEVEQAMDVIKEFASEVNFSLGHTTATYEEAKKAYDAGAKGATHLFNAMTGLNHRNPGVVGAVVNSASYCEVIADNIHLHPSVYSILAKMKKEERILLITDCMQAGGLKDGDYELGGQAVHVLNNKCTLDDGTIAGSVLKMSNGLKNFTELGGHSLEDVIPFATINPARYLGVEEEMGSLEKGKMANITIMDQEFNIKKTYVKGKKVYES